MMNKNSIIGLSVILGLSLWFNIYALNENALLSEDYTEVATDYNELLDEYEELERTNKRLNSKIESASVWFEMTEEEKENAKKEVEVRKEEERKAEEERLEKERLEREEQERLAKEEKEREEQEEINKRKGNINKSEYKEYKAYYDKDENGYDIIDSKHYPKEGDKVYIEGRIIDVKIYDNCYEYTITLGGSYNSGNMYVWVQDLSDEGIKSFYPTHNETYKNEVTRRYNQKCRTFYGEIIGYRTETYTVNEFKREIPIISVDYIEE